MLRIGPAGWDYKDWEGVVYPPGLKGTDRLTFLAALFDTIEINVTFYRPLAPNLTHRWLAALSDAPDFRFTAKLLNVFTHERRLVDSEVRPFKDGLRPLLEGDRLGVVLAQFPYSFHNTEENRAYLTALREAFEEFPLAVEVRHRSWQRREVREFFTEAGLNFANIDQPQVSYSLGKTVWATGPLGYLRCHGRRQEKWFDFGDDRQARYDYLYSYAELQELASRCRELMAKASEVYLIFNNHPHGQAVVNALEMTRWLLERHPTPPVCLVNAFPRLAG